MTIERERKCNTSELSSPLAPWPRMHELYMKKAQQDMFTLMITASFWAQLCMQSCFSLLTYPVRTL